MRRLGLRFLFSRLTFPQEKVAVAGAVAFLVLPVNEVSSSCYLVRAASYNGFLSTRGNLLLSVTAVLNFLTISGLQLITGNLAVFKCLTA